MGRFGLKPVFGGAGIGNRWTDKETIEAAYTILEENGCKTLDTGRIYGTSEVWLGKTQAGSRFTIDSKAPGGLRPGESTAAGIQQAAKESVEKTGVKQLDIYYIHAPDATIPLEEMMRGMNDAHRQGYFRRFGLSNYSASEVQAAYDICKANGYILPSVYQGNYSAIARRQETELFPTLRKLGMSFYAYSPIAGGFLTKTPDQLREASQAAGRFARGNPMAEMYGSLYARKESYLKALQLWADAAEAAGCSRAELAYRWVAFDSPLDGAHGDAIIFGTSRLDQIAETLGWLQMGSVGPEARAKIDQIWKTIEHEAPLDNYNSFMKSRA